MQRICYTLLIVSCFLQQSAFSQSIVSVDPDTILAGTTDFTMLIEGDPSTMFLSGSNTCIDLSFCDSACYGFNFNPFPSCIMFCNTWYNNASAKVNVPCDLPAGNYTVTVGAWGPLGQAVSVSHPVIIAEGPRIIGISPDTLFSGVTMDILISGADVQFTQATGTLSSSALTINSTQALNDSTLLANVTAPQGMVSAAMYMDYQVNPFRCTLDGSVWIDASTAIDETNAQGLSLWPNPSAGHVRFSSPHPVESIEFLSTKGDLIRTSTNSELANRFISLDGLPEGVVLVKMLTTEGVLLERLIVSH